MAGSVIIRGDRFMANKIAARILVETHVEPVHLADVRHDEGDDWTIKLEWEDEDDEEDSEPGNTMATAGLLPGDFGPPAVIRLDEGRPNLVGPDRSDSGRVS